MPKATLHSLQILRLCRAEESLDNIGQYWVNCPTEESKYQAIDNIYSVITIGQAIIFCQTKKTAAWLSSKLKKDGHAVSLLSGDLTVEERIQVQLEGKRENSLNAVYVSYLLALELYCSHHIPFLGIGPFPPRNGEDFDINQRCFTWH